MQETNILLVEDDRMIIENLTEFLKTEGFQVWSADGQEKAMKILRNQHFDLILLDITLAQGNGYSTCTQIKSHYEIPIIFLTALDDEFSDDYISKPFRPRELVSRMRTVLRRNSKTPNFLSCREIRIDPVKGIVTKRGEEIFLSALEYRLLLVFFQHRGMVMSRSMLLEEIWDIAGEYVNDNTLTVYIKRLRDKIEDNPQEPKIIKTVRGLGYKMEE